MKEAFYSNLRTALYNVIPTEEINKVMDVVSLQMGKYDLTLKPTEIVVYDHGDAEMIKRFFVAKATEGLTEESLKVYRRTLAQALNTIGRHIKDIQTDDVRLLLAQMRVTGKSAVYQNFVRRTLSSFFGWITKEDYVKTNPMLRIASIREPKKVKLPFSEDELEQLRLHAGSLRNQAIVEFMYSTGCRVSEMVALNIEDLNLVENEVMVLGKGKKYRMVYFSPRCKALLQQYIATRTDTEKALFVSDYSGMKSDINKDKHERLGKSGVEVMMREIGKRAGIGNVHPHRFRRTAATLALKRGMKITDVQKMLGHTDIKTTTIYAISTDEEVKREHEKYLI